MACAVDILYNASTKSHILRNGYRTVMEQDQELQARMDKAEAYAKKKGKNE